MATKEMNIRTGWKNINVLGSLETYKNSSLSYCLKDRNQGFVKKFFCQNRSHADIFVNQSEASTSDSCQALFPYCFYESKRFGKWPVMDLDLAVWSSSMPE